LNQWRVSTEKDANDTTPATDKENDKTYKLPERFNIADGYISFTDSFLYLGTTLTPDLRNDTDIQARIKKATTQMGALRCFFRQPYIDLMTKTCMYLTMLLNTVLWGC